MQKEKVYKNLIFDLDDTLIDNHANVKYAITELFNILGHDSSEEEVNRFLKHERAYWLYKEMREFDIPEEYLTDISSKVKFVRGNRFVLFFNSEITIEKGIEMNDKFISLLKEHVVEIDGAYDILKKLNKRYNIFVASNGPLEAMYEKLRKINVLDFVKDISSAEEFGNMKPSKEFFMSSIDKFCIDKNESLMIGDSFGNDVVGAHNIEMDSCWIKFREEKIDGNIIPTFIIDRLSDILHILGE